MQKYILIIFVVLALGAIIYLFMNNDNTIQRRTTTTIPDTPMTPIIPMNFPTYPSYPTIQSEHFTNGSDDNTRDIENFSQQNVVSGSEEEMGYNSQPQSIGQEQTGTQMNQLPSECYPKDVLSSLDLLPQDANTLWAQVSPSGQGSLADQNFLTSGFHIGINTVGQTLRNANRQVRSEPLNPQLKVSPWMQTTIEADINRRPLEIGSGDL
jgi:hypothetical protein